MCTHTRTRTPVNTRTLTSRHLRRSEHGSETSTVKEPRSYSHLPYGSTPLSRLQYPVVTQRRLVGPQGDLIVCLGETLRGTEIGRMSDGNRCLTSSTSSSGVEWRSDQSRTGVTQKSPRLFVGDRTRDLWTVGRKTGIEIQGLGVLRTFLPSLSSSFGDT